MRRSWTGRAARLLAPGLIAALAAACAPTHGQRNARLKRIEHLPLNVSSVAVTATHVLWLRADGSFRALERRTRAEDPALANALAQPGLSAIATAPGAGLWASDGDDLYEWMEGDRRWKRGFELDCDTVFVALTVLEGRPIAVCEGQVLDPAHARRFDVPKLGGQLEVRHLRPLAVLGQGSLLWIGTGQGEWGGHLVRLDLATGSWAHFYDAAYFVTGLTTWNGRLVASWGMSHFFSSSTIRIHGPDAQEQEVLLPATNDLYVQEVFADGPRLLALEQWTLADVTAGALKPAMDLPEQSYAPVITRIERLDPNTLLLVHADNGPLLVDLPQ